MMWYWGSGMHWWGWLIGAVMMVALWGLVVWGFWFFATSLMRGSTRGPHRQGAREILDERLARGEIDADEYRRLRDLIRGDDVYAGNGQTRAGTADRR